MYIHCIKRQPSARMNRVIIVLLSVPAWAGALALIGWAFDLEFLRRLHPAAAAMNPLTAICFILSSSAMWRVRLVNRTRKQSGIILLTACIIFILATGKLLTLAGINSEIDQMLFPLKMAMEQASGKANHMAYNTALCFILVALSLFFEYCESDKTKAVSNLLAMAVFFIAFYCLLFKIFSVREDQDLLSFVNMAPQSALSFFSASLAVMLANRNYGFMRQVSDNHQGGRILRWLIPATIIIPVLIAYFRLYFLTWRYTYSVELGVTVLSTGIGFSFAVIIWFMGRVLNESDRLHRDSERRLKREALLFNTTPGPVIYGRRDMVITEANPAAEKLFGFTREKLVGSKVDDFVKIEMVGETRESARAQVWDGTGSWKGEVAFVFSDGRKVDLLVTVQALDDKDGVRDGWMAVYTEISDLRQTQQRLEYALDGMQAGLWEWNLVKPENSWMSNRYRQLLGYSKEELPGTPDSFKKLMRPYVLEKNMKVLRSYAHSKQPFETELEYLCKDGTYRWFLVNGKVKVDAAGNAVSIIGSIINIDDKKRAQVTIQQQADLINMMPDGVIYGRTDKTIIRLNSGAEKLLGVTAAEALGKKWIDIVAFNPIGSTLAARAEELQRARFLREELEVTNKVGDKFVVLVTTRVFDNVLNEGPGWIAVITDITPLKMNNQLKAANNYLEQLAYISAHDLKSPLISLQGLSEMLAQSESITGQDKEIVNIFNETVVRMAKHNRALNEILLLRKNLENFNPDNDKVTTLQEVLSETTGILAGAISQSGATLHIALNDAAALNFPAVQLQTVLQNLLSNAIKYRDSERPLQIWITARKKYEDKVQIQVKDNGIGFNAERNKNRLFGLFKRFHIHTEGTGTGLYIVKTIVDSIGGTITVDSREGEGATFDLTLKKSIIDP